MALGRLRLQPRRSRTEAFRDDDELLEEHWSYMDAFAATMIARGPTFAAGRETVTGSLHVLGLPDRRCRAGVRRAGAEQPRGRLRRASRLALRQPARPDDVGVRGRGRRAAEVPRRRPTTRRPDRPERLPAGLRNRLILYGGLRALEGGEPVGVALAVQAESRQAVASSSPTLGSATRPAASRSTTGSSAADDDRRLVVRPPTRARRARPRAARSGR